MSDKTTMTGRLLYVAFVLTDVYTDEEAIGFFRSPQKVLGGRIPMELCKTEEGFAEVCDAAQAISDGVFV